MSNERRKLRDVHRQMIARCTDPLDAAFKNYGGRGISVCARWVESFDNFLADVSPRPIGGMMDRIDNQRGYGPDNFRWSDRKTQNSNRRSCIYVDDAGEKITLKEACRRRDIKYRPVVKRIQYRGWSIERALSEPLKDQYNRILLVRMDDQRRMLLLKDGSYRAVEKIELKDPR